MAPCFAALLRWVPAWWPADERRLVLAVDATTLGQRFTVLALSVVYRGCAIPVAWVVAPATQRGRQAVGQPQREHDRAQERGDDQGGRRRWRPP